MPGFSAHRAIDRFRREASRDGRHAQAALRHARGEPPAEDDEDTVRDDRLRLIFTCCHPALAPAVQVALTLRLVGGLTTGEIASANSSTSRARRYCWTTSAPPATRMSRSPAAARAWRSALSMPSFTKWNVVPPGRTHGSRTSEVSTKTGV